MVHFFWNLSKFGKFWCSHFPWNLDLFAGSENVGIEKKSEVLKGCVFYFSLSLFTLSGTPLG